MDGQNYQNRLQVEKNGIFLSGFTWERIWFYQKTHILGLISVGLSSSYCTCLVLRGAKTKQKKQQGMELPRMLPGLVLPPDCTHIPLFTASAFHFFLVYFLSHALIPTKSLPLSLYSLHLWKCHTLPLHLFFPLFHLPTPPPPPSPKNEQLSSTIFSHISSFSLRLFKQIRQFYSAFPSGSPHSLRSLFSKTALCT